VKNPGGPKNSSGSIYEVPISGAVIISFDTDSPNKVAFDPLDSSVAISVTVRSENPKSMVVG
jgi:hypothetical protein